MDTVRHVLGQEAGQNRSRKLQVVHEKCSKDLSTLTEREIKFACLIMEHVNDLVPRLRDEPGCRRGACKTNANPLELKTKADLSEAFQFLLPNSGHTTHVPVGSDLRVPKVL